MVMLRKRMIAPSLVLVGFANWYRTAIRTTCNAKLKINEEGRPPHHLCARDRQLDMTRICWRGEDHLLELESPLL